MKDNKFWILFWVVLLISLCILVLGGSAIYTSHVQSMADKGYVERLVPGRVESIWVKP